MAKKDVVEYFLIMQDQYIQMNNIVKTLQEELETGYIEQEQYDSVIEDINITRNNYERIAYIMMLLNQPQRDSKKAKERAQNKDMYDYLKNASTEVVVDENKNALDDLRKIVKEFKEKNGNKETAVFENGSIKYDYGNGIKVTFQPEN